MIQSISKLISTTALLAIFASGCASFPNNGVPTVDKLPDKSAFRNKPSIFLDAKMTVDMSGGKNAPAENKPGTDKFKEMVEKATKDSNMFGNYTLDPFKGREMDYTVKLELLNHGSSGAAAVSGFITGLSLFIIPGAATDHYKLTAAVTDRSGRKLATYELNDSVKTWIGIWFIPFMGKSPATVVPEVWENMVKTIFQNISNDKLMKYSFMPNDDHRIAALDGHAFGLH